ncbi:hypothetical protein HD597_011324 [Nonomuraea thailandensis]|uniref:Uncharacterized protein n=1 Tax=Nonomuraea thailandensis TaxID=1188745 RepID=A0A9X2GRK7_9ACTN|nr:hypothetical protein [Nonomuraea thailandensis]MCP2364304.1 hypothetical protein [Nonomuraea thailandensis]
MHWHAYTWTGNGEDRGREAERRSTSPDFLTSHLPPMRTGDWLAKPASRIAATYEQQDLDAALEWMAAQYEQARGSFVLPEGVPLEDRLRNARGLLPAGVDVQWGEWLLAGRFVTIGMICCPNKHVDHPCPIRHPAGAQRP